ncbi:MAG: MFS transporter, partial [Acidimicrobiales bacterium]
VQGVGGAVMFATSLALIADAFRGRERGTAFGIYGAVIGGAVAIGPLVGGALTTGVGWQWIFFVNVPIGIFAIVLTLTRVERSKDPSGRRVDWMGFATFSGALLLLVLALIRGDTDGWGSALVVGLFAGAALLLGVFVVAEARQRAPMLDLSLFRRPAMIGVSAAAFCVSASVFALFLYITLYLQDDLGYGALGAGLRFLPISMLAFFVAPVAGKLTVRLDARYMLGTGMLLAGVACVLLSLVSRGSTWAVLIPGFLVGGVGIGMVNPVLASSAVAVVRPERSGMASGANNTFRQVGIATGIAALGTIFASQIKTAVTSSLAATSVGRAVMSHAGASLATSLESGHVRTVTAHMPRGQAHALLVAYQQGFAGAFDVISLVAAAIAFAGSLLAFVLVRERDFVVSQGHEGRPGGPASPEGAVDGPAPGAPAAPNGSGIASVPTPT